MDLSRQKEQFSIAYFHAVAAVCGLKLFRCDVDDESVDITVAQSGGGGTVKSPRLDVQLKCSSRDLLKDDGIHFPLKRKNFDDLREPALMVPKILVVLLVPDELADWCENEPGTSMILRQNAWWHSLVQEPERIGVATPTVVLPRAQIFDSAALSNIMDRAGRREPI